ncbi:site-specific integrase [Uliginosibacterium aquaticum]|uniref:Site-specific integrase n=1 Tax=Uliginosibacterium aquaticum TaxID=2731212 RepID=A0ABX2IF24_9RHOO|nr:site-specific integrase [Uliginosibacterium aquaticum]NSL53547.1 site-specific integrase [Uliginosibacterium aquaticum]
MKNTDIPDLTFPMVEYGRHQTPWDLRIFLYRGATGENARVVAEKINSGLFGDVIEERLGLVNDIHAVLISALVSGGSPHTARAAVRNLRTFWTWADQDPINRPISYQTVESTYRHWCDYLIHLYKTKSVSGETMHTLASTVASVLNRVFERKTSLLETTRVRRPKKPRRAVGGRGADKSSLSSALEFGGLLIDVINGLSADALLGPLPVRIKLRSGQELVEWSGMKDRESLVAYKSGYKYSKYAESQVRAAREQRENNTSMSRRFPLANLRLEAELLLFISQTGMNLAQAYRLKISQYSYKSSIDGYEVREYKNRKSGEVLFEVYSEYRRHFEAYLSWRRKFFSCSQELFPFVRINGRSDINAPYFTRFRNDICLRSGIKFVPPSVLRKVRVNWLLKRSRDPELAAEQSQHTKETLIRVYEEPSLQVAMAEIVQFWPLHDPSTGVSGKESVAPGICDGVPELVSNIPEMTPVPDCKTPTGCLFCAHHRDIDSQDYVWSVASMRCLKMIVLQGYAPIQKGKVDPAAYVDLAIDVLSSKLKWFSGSNALRKSWVHEALERVDEGSYHPHWKYLIESTCEV